MRGEGYEFVSNKIYGVGAVQTGHKCFVIGGFQDYSNQIYVYDLNANHWSAFRIDGGDIVYGQVKMIFNIADILFAYVWHDRYHVYNLVALELLELKQWRKVEHKRHPILSSGVSGCLIEQRGEAVITCPKAGAKPSDVWVFRIKDKSWLSPTTKGNQPWLEADHCSCTTGLQVFVLGGRYLSYFGLHILDVTTLPYRWSTPSGLGYSPKPRFCFQASCTVKRIFVYGGFSGEDSFDVFLIKEQRWLKGPRFESNWSSGTSCNAVVQTAEKLLVFGGFSLPAQTPLEISAAQ